MGKDCKLRMCSSAEGLRDLQTTHFPNLFRAKPSRNSKESLEALIVSFLKRPTPITQIMFLVNKLFCA